MRIKTIEIGVGLFMLAGIIALLSLAFNVSGLSQFGSHRYYTINAEFDNIGGLKVRAPVKMAGVVIGRVDEISLDPNTLRAEVVMHIDDNVNNLPKDTSASILTQGILGANYISLAPGFEHHLLKSGARLQTTHSAIILEDLIGKLVYQFGNKDKAKKKE